MKNALIGSLSTLIAGAGLALAEAPPAVSLPVEAVGSHGLAYPAGCDAPAADLCGECPRQERLWFSGEYLLWWFKKSPEPVPLATAIAPGTVAVPGAPPPGAVGGPGTTVVLGGSAVDPEERSGGRFTAGYWFDSERTFGVEGSYLFLPRRSTQQIASTDGAPTSPVLTVPFVNALTGMESVGPLFGGPITAPGLTSGADTLAISSSLQGAELNGVFGLYGSQGLRVEALAGFRWLHLRENLTYTNSVVGLPGGPAALFFYNARDEFDTRNDFYGGQLGLRAEYSTGKLFASAAAKVALGGMDEAVTISGSTTTNFFTAGPLATFPGGVFAQPGNSGHFTSDRFAVVPEAQVSVGYQVADWARVFVGYTFLYASDVVRPGNTIDRTINPTQTNFALQAGVPPVGPSRPQPLLNESSFWAQGISFGLEFRY